MSNVETIQLSENLFLKKITKGDKTFYLLKVYYTVESDGKTVTVVKDNFVCKAVFDELSNL